MNKYVHKVAFVGILITKIVNCNYVTEGVGSLKLDMADVVVVFRGY